MSTPEHPAPYATAPAASRASPPAADAPGQDPPPAPHDAQECARRIAALRALVEAGIQISATLSLDVALQRLVDVGRGVLGARYAAIGEIDPDTCHLNRFLYSGLDPATAAAIGTLPRGHGILGALLHEAKPLRLANLAADPRSVGFPANHPPMRSFLGVPVVARGRVFGRLYFTEKEGADCFSAEDEQLALGLAAQAAVAIENAWLFEEVRQQQEQLVSAQRLSAIGTLAATIGHELRNPLSVISNAAYFLRGKVSSDDPRAARNLELIAQEVRRSTRIIEELLDFSRARPPQPVPISAATLVRETLAHREIPPQVTVETHLAADGPRLFVDPVQMEQALGNLVTNAVEAMPEGGTLRLEATTVEGRTRLQVHDTGVGIAPEHLPRIFEPLFTTKTRGFGLGLALARRVVEAHQGTLRVQSEVGRDTTITLELPPAPPAES